MIKRTVITLKYPWQAAEVASCNSLFDFHQTSYLEPNQPSNIKSAFKSVYPFGRYDATNIDFKFITLFFFRRGLISTDMLLYMKFESGMQVDWFIINMFCINYSFLHFLFDSYHRSHHFDIQMYTDGTNIVLEYQLSIISEINFMQTF